MCGMTTTETSTQPELVLSFSAYGRAVEQGSKVTGISRDGRAFMREANRRSRPWRDHVTQSAGESWGDAPLIDEACMVEVDFVRVRPSSHFTQSGALSASGRRQPYPSTKPDVDKLSRTILDALTGVVLRDDSRVVRLVSNKMWGEQDHVRVKVYVLGVEDAAPAQPNTI